MSKAEQVRAEKLRRRGEAKGRSEGGLPAHREQNETEQKDGMVEGQLSHKPWGWGGGVEIEAFPLSQDGPQRDRLLLDQHGGQAAPMAAREMSIPPLLGGWRQEGPLLYATATTGEWNFGSLNHIFPSCVVIA